MDDLCPITLRVKRFLVSDSGFCLWFWFLISGSSFWSLVSGFYLWFWFLLSGFWSRVVVSASVCFWSLGLVLVCHFWSLVLLSGVWFCFLALVSGSGLWFRFCFLVSASGIWYLVLFSVSGSVFLYLIRFSSIWFCFLLSGSGRRGPRRFFSARQFHRIVAPREELKKKKCESRVDVRRGGLGLDLRWAQVGGGR